MSDIRNIEQAKLVEADQDASNKLLADSTVSLKSTGMILDNSCSSRQVSVQFSGDELSTDGSSWNLKDANGKNIADENSKPGRLQDGTELQIHNYKELPNAFTLTAANADEIVMQKCEDEDQSFLAVRLKRTEQADHKESLFLPSGDKLILCGDHWSLKDASGTVLSNDRMVNNTSPFIPLQLVNGAKIVHTLPVGDRQLFQISYPNGDKAVIGETIGNSSKVGTDYSSVALTWKTK